MLDASSTTNESVATLPASEVSLACVVRFLEPIVLKQICPVVIVSILGAIDLSAQAPVSQATFKATVEVVPISVVVRDRHGKFVSNLSPADFEIFDNGSKRQIIDFGIDATGPITLAVMVDVSGSMRIGNRMTLARKVVDDLAAQFVNGRDEVALYTFDAGLHAERPFATQASGFADSLTSLEPFGTTSLYDAIAITAREVETRQSRRRAIVVLTDGLDTSSALTPTQVSGLASSIDVPVYVVLTVPPADKPQDSNRPPAAAAKATADLGDLARWTGGELMWADAKDNPTSTAHRIVSELRHQYLIAIEAANEPSWRPLAVRMRPRGLSIRARTGYFGPQDAVFEDR